MVRAKPVPYKLAPGQYDQMLEEQDGRCYICRNQPRKMRLVVDHDHTTGRVRGLLCVRCNRALGAYEGKDVAMVNLIRYLRDILADHNKHQKENSTNV